MNDDLRSSGKGATRLLKSGVAGLDPVLGGGFTSNRLYLVEGMPGAGKTTLAMQFLLAGIEAGERALYVTLSESEEELRSIAGSHGWDHTGIDTLEVVPTDDSLDPESQYTVFHPSDVELASAFRKILTEVERIGASRIIIDSLSELRLLAEGPLQFRRHLLALKRFFSGKNCTVLVLDDQLFDTQIQSIAHCVIRLEQMPANYGSHRRRLQVGKYRGMHFMSGFHDFAITRGGVVVYPRLVAAETRSYSAHEPLKTGVAEMDRILGGGLERGTSTLIIGAAGSGKSTLTAQVSVAACERGERADMFTFDETFGTLSARLEGLGVPFMKHYKSGLLKVHQIDPAEMSPGEFIHKVVRAAEEGSKVITIDSLNGYLHAMPEEKFLLLQLHELLTWLGQKGVATMLVSVQQGLIGQMSSPIDTSYLADTVVLLRYFESAGEVRQAISIMKKRGGMHERTVSEFRIDQGGIRVGEPLRQFRGVLTGVPVYDGANTALMRNRP
ncbi:circadian clock protein KaiC [Betaproteobacteria bacterium GR16-43]|nr:circadian clock protein KaiC [Betaproteobacteria bacterium GR16-43]